MNPFESLLPRRLCLASRIVFVAALLVAGSERVRAQAGGGGNCNPPAGLVGWWPFDGSLLNNQGNNPATTVNSPAFVPAKVNQGLQFDGLTDSARVAADPSLDVGAGSGMSIELWVSTPDLQTSQPLVEWNRNQQGVADTIGAHFWINVQNGGFVTGGGPGALFANLFDNNNQMHVIHSLPGLLTAGVFNHVALTYDKPSGMFKFFVNGALTTQTNIGSFTPQTSYDLYFGARPAANVPIPNQKLTGVLDEVSIYNRALADSEVAAIAAAGKCAPAQVACVVPPNLVAWWQADGNALDSVGSNHGLNVGGVTYAPGKRGLAFNFTGNGSDYIEVAPNPTLDFVGQMTIEMWAKRTGNAAIPMQLFGKRIGCLGSGAGATANYQIFLNRLNTAEGVGMGNSGVGVITGMDIPLGVWTHLVGTCDGTNFAFYINGQFIAKTPGSLGPTNSVPLKIGGAGACTAFAGQLDDIALYSRVLTAAEINALYQTGGDKCVPSPTACTTPANLVAWWRGDGNALDSVGTNHGINVGGVTYAPGKSGQAFQFSGTGAEYIEVPNSPSLSFATNGPISVEVWTYRTGTNPPNMQILGKRVGCLGSGGGDTINYHLAFNLQTAGDGLAFGGVDTNKNAIYTGLDLPKDTWTHLLATFDGSKFAFYVNGQLVRTFIGQLGAPNVAPFRIGMAGDCFVAPFAGLLDEIAIYNRALTASEVSGLFFANGDKCLSTTIAGMPTIVTGPSDMVVTAAQNATFYVSATGANPLTYQWTFNGLNIPGANSSALFIANASQTNSGRYAVRVGNSAGAVTSGSANLTVFYPLPVISGQPSGLTAVLGGSVTLSVAATGIGPLGYLWRRDGVNIPGATNATLTISRVQASDAGVYSVAVSNPGGAVVSSNAVIDILGAPAITVQPVGQTVALGSAVGFSVAATGTAPLVYQWRFNGMDIPGEINSTLSLASAQVANAGIYSVVVANIAGVARSAPAELRFIGGPVITSQPAPQVVLQNTSASFAVGATGDPTLTYQWRLNGAPLPGANAATLAVGNAQFTNGGVYSVMVTNGLGSAVSVGALLTVVEPLLITQQPTNQMVTAGGAVQFVVAATGTPPLSYQWRFNGADIVGEVGTNLLLRTIQVNQGGDYSVMVRDSYNSVTSSLANLLVTPALPSVVLFDGTDTSRWVPLGGSGAISWPIVAGNSLQVNPGGGSIQSTQTFTDFLLHLEFRTPSPADPAGPNKGNSGVFLQNRYELQIFDSFGVTPAGTNDNGAILGLLAPRVNASLAPGEWQTLDVTFHAAQFNGTNKVANARLSATLNGVVIHDDVAIPKATAGGARELPLAGPIVLEEHGSRVEFQNIRVTPLDAAPDFAWVRSEAGVNANGLARGIRVDRRGNVYVTGTFVGDAVFGGTNLVSQAGTSDNAFVAKYDSAGTLLWAVGSGSTRLCRAYDLEIDASGGVYITGELTRPDTCFGVSLVGGGSAQQDIYVAKFDTDGHPLWLTATDGPGDSRGKNIAVDLAGNSYIAGSTSASKTFGSLTLTTIRNGGTGSSVVIAKLDPSGVPLWVRVEIGAVGSGVALNHLNEVFVVGYFNNVGTIGGVRFNLPGSDQGIFLEKLSNNGQPLWVSSWSATSVFRAEQVAVDGADNIVLTGKFQGAATFGTNVLSTDTVAAFIAKCDRSGNVLWVRQIDNSGNSGFSGSVATDGGNNIFAGLTPFDSVQTGTATLPGFGYNDALVLKYNPSGTLLWAVEAGGTGNDISRAVAVDTVGNVYMAGEISRTATFGTTKIVSRGGADIFVAKLGNTPLPTDTVAQQAPYILLQPQGARALVDLSADFAVVAGGSQPLVFQWRLNGADLLGETNASLIVTPVQFTNAGGYSVFITNQFGAVLSSNAVLTVEGPPVITVPPQEQTVALDGTAQFTVAALGTQPLSYLWRFNGLNIPGATTATLQIDNAQVTDAGNYLVIVANSAGVAISSNVTLRIAGAPQITTPPQGAVVAAGAPVSLSVVASGDGPLSYQWSLSGVDLVGAVNATLNLPAVQRADVGAYAVRVGNVAGQVTSADVIVRIDRGPVIVAQPLGQEAAAGGSVTLNVGVIGDAPLAFQWRLNGALLPGETNLSLTLNTLAVANSGNYSVLVTNSLGLATSANAALNVFVPLAITTPPVSQVIPIGGLVRFVVGAVGSPPFVYQWLFNGTNLTGQVNADLILTNAQPAQSGNYSVVVNDARGSVTSSVAGLQVFQPLPSFTLFDGTDFSKFVSSRGGGPVPWTLVAPNVMEVVPGTGSIQSTQTFTDFILHVEFRTPNNPRDPARGDSGVYVQARYEIQIFDSFGVTVPNANDCGALFGIIPPSVNACLAPGDWQTYDITFHAPQWNGNTKVRNAHATVVLNGVVVQNDVTIPGPTRRGNAEGPTAGPIFLQDNGSRVQFRNVVVTPLDTSPDFAWGVAGGGSTLGDEQFGALAVDPNGYSYFAGMYRGDLTLGSNVLAATTTRNAVFGKLDTAGKVVWLQRASSGLPHVNYGTGIAVDGQGNVFGAGTCERYITFLGQQFYPSGNDQFLAKYDANGNEIWIRTGGTSVAADAAGNSYTVGDSAAATTFGTTVLPAVAKGYVVKYDAAGNVVWVASYSGSGTTTTTSVAVDAAGNVFVGGAFSGTVGFGGNQLTSAGSTDGFVLKYSPAGNLVWARQFGAGGNDGVSALAADAHGNLLALGLFQNTIVVGPNTLTCRGNEEVVLAKYDANGTVLWARQTDGASVKTLGGLAVDGAGSAYFVGNYNGSLTFSSRAVARVNFASDIFASKYDAGGNFVWARATTGQPYNSALGAGVDAAGNVYLGGEMTGTNVLDAITLTTSGARDIFVAKLGDNRVVFQSPFVSVQPRGQDVTEGASVLLAPTVGGAEPLAFQWRFNGTNVVGQTNATFTLNAAQAPDAGAYSLFLTNQYGAVLSSNAVVTVLGLPVLTQQPLDQQAYVGGGATFVAQAAGTPPLTYLWRFNNVNIPGGTNATLRVPGVTTDAAGDYAVIVGNPAGVVLSQKATLTVLQSPFVLDPPHDLRVPFGATAMFGVRLLGETPFTFQWRRNGADLAGETNPTLSLAAVNATNAGRYSVAVTNAFGGVLSAEAELSVTRPTFTFGRATNGSGGLALSLPLEATGFVLESSPTLGASAVWTVVTTFTTLPNGPLILPIAPGGGFLFYRLRTP